MNLRRDRTIAGIIALLMLVAVGIYALYSDIPLVSVGAFILVILGIREVWKVRKEPDAHDTANDD